MRIDSVSEAPLEEMSTRELAVTKAEEALGHGAILARDYMCAQCEVTQGRTVHSASAMGARMRGRPGGGGRRSRGERAFDRTPEDGVVVEVTDVGQFVDHDEAPVHVAGFRRAVSNGPSSLAGLA